MSNRCFKYREMKIECPYCGEKINNDFSHYHLSVSHCYGYMKSFFECENPKCRKEYVACINLTLEKIQKLED